MNIINILSNFILHQQMKHESYRHIAPPLRKIKIAIVLVLIFSN